MLNQLEIEGFKSFGQSTVPFGPFTLLVGANASGKSNVREALRFLHGVARGYSLAEVLGEKWGQGGEPEWKGVRGGALQAFRRGGNSFSLRACFVAPVRTASGSIVETDAVYDISLVMRESGIPLLQRERLTVGRYGYDTHPDDVPRPGATERIITARLRKGDRGAPPDEAFVRDRPILRQLDETNLSPTMRRHLESATDFLGSMRFLDLDPELARLSSARGVKTLGDRGQNLSSVLAELSSDDDARTGLVAWIRALTPMDAVDIEFETDLNNQTLAILVEDDGERTPLTSASDGTVRFLAMVALMYSPDPPSLVFLEEIENGIHPHRVALLLELLEERVVGSSTQIVATSHSPQLLNSAWGAEGTRPVLVTRVPGRGSIAVDVKCEPDFVRVIQDAGAEDDAASLMSDGWFEDVSQLLYAPDVA